MFAAIVALNLAAIAAMQGTPAPTRGPLTFGEFNGKASYGRSPLYLGCIEFAWMPTKTCTLSRTYFGEAEGALGGGKIEINVTTGRPQRIYFIGVRTSLILDDLVARYGQPNSKGHYWYWKGFDDEAVLWVSGETVEIHFPKNSPPEPKPEKPNF